MPHLRNPVEIYFDKFTRYHIYFFFFLFLSKLPIFWHVLNLMFLSPPMDYICKDDGTVNKCPCENPEWNRSVFTETLQTKYGILCKKTWVVSFSQSMLYVGMLIGAMSFGILSDKFGRLFMLTISCLVTATAGCLVIVMPSTEFFIIMRCFEGIGVGGAIVTGYVLCVEYCGVSYREMVTALYHIPINVGHMTLPVVSYFLRHCDTFQLALSIPVYFFVLMYWLLLESPKWLIDNNNIEKASLVMQKIAKFNGQPIDTIRTDMEAFYSESKGQKQTKLKFWQVFQHRRLTLNLLCTSVIYFVCGMGYYGVSQYIGKMSGDIHLNVAISGALLIPATCIAAVLLTKLGRRTFLMATNFTSGILMIVVICIPATAHMARVAVACICNCFFFMSFIIVFLYGVELFPTSIRNSVLGFLSTLSRVGQISAPPINALPESVSGAIFGAMAIVGGLLCIPLPETKNLELPSTLEDTKGLPRRTSRSNDGNVKMT